MFTEVEIISVDEAEEGQVVDFRIKVTNISESGWPTVCSCYYLENGDYVWLPTPGQVTLQPGDAHSWNTFFTMPDHGVTLIAHSYVEVYPDEWPEDDEDTKDITLGGAPPEPTFSDLAVTYSKA